MVLTYCILIIIAIKLNKYYLLLSISKTHTDMKIQAL